MKRTRPLIYNSKAYKDLVKELGKPPKIKIRPVEQTPEEKKKAKRIQDLINYQFETDYNGFATKYFELLEVVQREYARSVIHGTQVRQDVIDRAIDYATDNLIPPKEGK